MRKLLNSLAEDGLLYHQEETDEYYEHWGIGDVDEYEGPIIMYEKSEKDGKVGWYFYANKSNNPSGPFSEPLEVLEEFAKIDDGFKKKLHAPGTSMGDDDER